MKNLDLDKNGNLRVEEQLIACMRADGLIVTDAIAEDIYAMRFNGEIDAASDFKLVFARAKKNVGGVVEAVTKTFEGEIL